MFRSKCRICHTINSIWTCRKYRVFVKVSTYFSFTCLREFKLKLKSLGFSYPVTLHRDDLIWPFPFKQFQVIKQFICILDDIQVIPRHLFKLYFIVTTPTTTLFYLLICKYCMTLFTPVHRCRLTVK